MTSQPISTSPTDLLDRALESHAGIKVTLETERQANSLQLALYRARSRDRRRQEPGAPSPYDALHFSIDTETRRGKPGQPAMLKVFTLTITRTPTAVLDIEEL